MKTGKKISSSFTKVVSEPIFVTITKDLTVSGTVITVPRNHFSNIVGLA